MNTTSLKRSAAAMAVAVSILGASVGVAAAQQGTPPDQAGWTGPAGQNQVGQMPQPGPGQRPGQGDQNGERQQPTQEQIQQMQQQRDAMQQQFVDALAKNLNLDSATVKAALEQTQKDMQAARITEIQQAVQDGKLTQDQANQIIQRIQNGPQGGGPGFGGPGMGGPGMGGPGGPNGGGR